MAMLLKMIENNMPIDEIVYCNIMATSTIGAEYPEMYKYLDKVDRYLIKIIGKKITRLQSPISFEKQFYTVKQRGKYEGKIYGFPWNLGAWCNSVLKVSTLDKYFKQQGKYISYIGIAYDEPKRYERLAANERAPLYEWRMTEKDCLQYTKEKGLYNPLYDKFKRLGCWFCVKQGLDSFRVICSNFDIDTEIKTITVKTFLDKDIALKYLKQQIKETKEEIENEDLDFYSIEETEESYKRHDHDSSVQDLVEIWLEEDNTYDEIILQLEQELKNNKENEKIYEM